MASQEQEKPSKRTLRQNRSLHLLMTQVSDELNESGLSMMRVLRSDAEVRWTPVSVKEYLLRPFVKAMFAKESTKDLTTKEVGEAMDAMCDHLAKVTGKVFDIPSIESLINQMVDRGQR